MIRHPHELIREIRRARVYVFRELFYSPTNVMPSHSGNFTLDANKMVLKTYTYN